MEGGVLEGFEENVLGLSDAFFILLIGGTGEVGAWVDPLGEVLNGVVSHDFGSIGLSDDSAEGVGIAIRSDAMATALLHDFIDHDPPMFFLVRQGLMFEALIEGLNISETEGSGIDLAQFFNFELIRNGGVSQVGEE